MIGLVFHKTMNDFEKIHQKCDVTGSMCGSAIGLGKHKSLQQCFNEKKDSRIGIKQKRTPYEESILQYGKINECRGLRMANYFWDVKMNEDFFYLPLLDGVDKRYGATPDGLLGSIGLIEVKCPWTKEIYKDIREGSIPLDHFCQIQMELACTARDFAVYVCWTPLETAIIEMKYSHEAWDDIYTRLMFFSHCLNSNDVDMKFKKGEKAALEARFRDYAKKSIFNTTFITTKDNKPFYV